jgi:hypothetical protein
MSRMVQFHGTRRAAGSSFRAMSTLAAPAEDDRWEAARAQSQRLFRGCVALTTAITLVWLALLLTGRGSSVLGRPLDPQAPLRLLVGFLFMGVLWGWLWYGVKRLLLRKVVGLTREETDATFRSRVRRPFDLAALLQRHSERLVRIADMIGRRGRYVTIGMLGYSYIYTRIALQPRPDFLVAGLQESLFDALGYSWLMLALFYSDGFLGRVAYGAQTRIMDGVLGRANALVILTLWSLFKFIMVPLGSELAATFPPSTYGALFAIVWISYLGSDALSEIVGSLWGRQRLRVWGIGEVNRKSVAGTVACFLGSLAICLWLVHANGLGLPWVALALAVSVSNTTFELFSPRGTDDFTMATANALLCWAFGRLVY